MQKMRGQAQGGQMGAAQMERQGSQMDVSGPRSGSPNTGGDAPSPKRQRIDGGNMQQINQQRPGQPGQMQGQVGTPSETPLLSDIPAETLEMLRVRGIDPHSISRGQLLHLSQQPTNTQAKSMEVYSHAMQQTMQAALQRTNSNANKGMPPNPAMGPGGAQSSPMNQQGFDGNGAEMYPGRMPMQQNGAAVPATGQQAQTGNHALQDYQMQLMLLEQQNKKRLLMARQEQDGMAHPPNGGQFAPGMSPQGGRAGDPSPNPNDMQRGTPNMKKAGMSPNGDMAGRGSPAPGMMDPNAMNPAMRPQMMMGPNGQPIMRPPSSHPGVPLNPQQMEMMRNGQMMPNGGNWQGGPQPPPGQMMPGQQPGPGGPPGQQPNMTPRQGNMPPPPAPGQNPGGTQPSSPQTQAQPPTPNQANKPKPGAKKDAAANKKVCSAINSKETQCLQNSQAAANKKGPAAASENEGTNQPPTPTPPPPVTPNNPNGANFQQNKNLQMPNGQPQGQQPNQPGQPGAPPVQQPGNDMNNAPFGALPDDQFNGGMDFANLDTGDVLDNFDFDSFLNQTGDDGGLAFDANFAFGDGGNDDLAIGGN